MCYCYKSPFNIPNNYSHVTGHICFSYGSLTLRIKLQCIKFTKAKKYRFHVNNIHARRIFLQKQENSTSVSFLALIYSVFWNRRSKANIRPYGSALLGTIFPNIFLAQLSFLYIENNFCMCPKRGRYWCRQLEGRNICLLQRCKQCWNNSCT